MTSGVRRRVASLATVVTIALAGAAGWWLLERSPHDTPDEQPAGVRGAGAITISATGDSLVVKPWPAAGVDREFDQVAAILGRASVAITNLEESLAAPGARSDPAGHAVTWPLGPAESAADLRRAGFTVVTRANNHGADGGADAITATSRALEHAGLHHTGAGSDLDAARGPLVLGEAPRRVAIVAVTTSASDEARATRTRGEVSGRPGVSGLRVATDITADPSTYAALAGVARATGTGRESPSGLQLSGRLIKPGPATSVRLVVDPDDLADVLDTIAAARARADVVVVSVHSHEPGNLSVEPAVFLREFARQAIDRGANLVVGHGPRQLRGIEVYHRGAILYSLGDFAFDAAAIPSGAADVYDANTDLRALALDALGPTALLTLPAYNEDVWWESVVATATFDGGVLAGVRLDAIDLGATRTPAVRGRPRLAQADRARAILLRMADLSKPYGTAIRVDADGSGAVELPPIASR